jgi:hypothetical protein
MKKRTPAQMYRLRTATLRRLMRRGGRILQGTRAERARATNLFAEARRLFQYLSQIDS